jgi:hypothetical protein
VLCDARALVEKSRGEPPPPAAALQEPSSTSSASSSSSSSYGGDRDTELAVPRLTAGGIITLERTLAKLEVLQQAPTS